MVVWRVLRKCAGTAMALRITGRHGRLLMYTPEVDGLTPVRTAVRDALHTAAAQGAFVKERPRAAKRGIFTAYGTVFGAVAQGDTMPCMEISDLGEVAGRFASGPR